MSSTDSASRFNSTYAPRRAAERTLRSPLMMAAAEQAEHFREVVLSKISRLTPKMPKQIASDVEDEWGGEVQVRRVFSALSRLLKEGKIKRTPDGYLLARCRP